MDESRMKTVAVFFGDIARWATLPVAVALAVVGGPTVAQGQPINDCFAKVLDHARVSQLSDDLFLLRSRVFPVAGYASVQAINDNRIPDSAARQAVAQLAPVYEDCVKNSYAENAKTFDELHESHLAARVALLHHLADGAFTYAEYARQLDMLRGQLGAGVFYWQNGT